MFKPVRTLLWYILSIALIYILLFTAIGMETALLSLGVGKPYNEVLLSLRELKKKIPEDRKRIFYIGDSTVALVDNDVAPPAVLQAALEREHGKNSVQVVDWAFGGASMLHYYCLACKATDYSPSLIVFNINYRSYTEGWFFFLRDRHGESPFRELTIFTPFREDFSSGIISPIELENITWKDRLELELSFWETLYLGGLKLWLKDSVGQLLFGEASIEDKWNEDKSERLTEGHALLQMLRDRELTPELLQSFYPMEISRDNLEFLRLKALCDALERRDIPFMAYLTPLNIQQLKDHGVFDGEAFGDNVRYMEEIVTSHGGVFLDLSHALEEEDFYDRLEHYNPAGGEKVARKLLPTVEKILWNNQGHPSDTPAREAPR